MTRLFLALVVSLIALPAFAAPRLELQVNALTGSSAEMGSVTISPAQNGALHLYISQGDRTESVLVTPKNVTDQNISDGPSNYELRKGLILQRSSGFDISHSMVWSLVDLNRNLRVELNAIVNLKEIAQDREPVQVKADSLVIRGEEARKLYESLQATEKNLLDGRGGHVSIYEKKARELSCTHQTITSSPMPDGRMPSSSNYVCTIGLNAEGVAK